MPVPDSGNNLHERGDTDLMILLNCLLILLVHVVDHSERCQGIGMARVDQKDSSVRILCLFVVAIDLINDKHKP